MKRKLAICGIAFSYLFSLSMLWQVCLEELVRYMRSPDGPHVIMGLWWWDFDDLSVLLETAKVYISKPGIILIGISALLKEPKTSKEHES